MKKCKRILSALLAAILLVGAVPAFAANGDTGLNGSTCSGTDFDKSAYTDVTGEFDVRNSRYQWPSSGKVLIEASGSNWVVTDFKGITIPAGLVVDIYQYYKFAGDADTTYKLVAHFDTTDGNAYTIGSSTTNVSGGNTAIASNPPTSSVTPDNSGKPKWGNVKRTFKAGTPSASYKNSYDDVASDMWCYDAIMTMTDGGLLNGYGNGKFGPNDPLTRAQLAIIRARMNKANFIKGFETAKVDNGYQPFLDKTTATRAWAAILLAGNLPTNGRVSLTSYELSLVETNGKSLLTGYATNGKSSVGSMQWALYDTWRASLGKNLTYRASIDEFPDAADIHRWIDENVDTISNYLYIRGSHEYKIETCETYFLRAYNLGMFRGVDAEGTFNPYGALTRGQLCQALYNVGWTYSGCLDYNVFYHK